jgi:hypothetical protein
METSTIKTIVESECPHCKQPIIVEFNTIAPQIGSIYRRDDIEAAKRDAIERIKALDIDGDKKELAIKWVTDEETIFGASEVEAIINNLLIPIE